MVVIRYMLYKVYAPLPYIYLSLSLLSAAGLDPKPTVVSSIYK